MNGKSKESGSVQNIGCTVKDCKYHSSLDFCNAKQINVQSENAKRKAETFCATFENRGSM